ncbi:V-type proton ATPase subunit H-like [Rhopilema esculentum]|uniref:V-type proton ATPase subunit H-like n=1 Tax=Rhopilema esculentum TaxID=499914 RepID=UPI0031D30808
MSVQYPEHIISYPVHSDTASYGQSGTGIPLSHLDSKLVEVRGYQINWQTFHQTGVLSKDEWDFIGDVDAKSRKERTELISKYIEKSIKALISMWGNFKNDHPLAYILVMTDDTITDDRSTVKEFHAAAKRDNVNLWKPLFSLLNRDNPVILQMASRIFAKLACWSKFKCPNDDLNLYLSWLKGQLAVPGNEYLQNVAECLQWMMRVEEYRMPFVKVNGINGIVSVLLSNVGFQLQYQLIFSLWMLSFCAEVADQIVDNNVIPVLADILRNSQKEKVTRIVLATLRNLLQKPGQPKLASVSMIHCKLLPLITVMSSKNWDDEDIKEDVDFLLEKLNDGVQDLSTFDEYVAEVKSGRLEWSPVHKSDKFWRENAIRLTDNNYELLRILVRLLETAKDPVILAVACHDLGEFVRLYPRGKPVFDGLGGKELIMLRMTHEEPAVRYEALLAVQKLMVHNWEFLGKQLKVDK